MRALFPGRFQPFHRGHRQFVERVAEEADEVDGVGRLREVTRHDQHAVDSSP